MRKRTKLLVAAAGVAALVGGTAYATIPDSSGTFHACLANGGSVKIVDPAAGGKCSKNETAIAWNAQGVPGPAGPQGPAGPAGPAGSIARLDDLEGIPCHGVNGKIATVHVSYGNGIVAPVQLQCITHLVANPGAFAFDVTGGELQAFAGGYPLPSGKLTGGQIDFSGHITAPASDFRLDDIAFDGTSDLGGFTSVHVFGTVSFASAGISGDLDPGAGTMTLTDRAYASVTFTATLGGAMLYSGTCAFGTADSPIALTLQNTTPYSQSTGEVTLQSTFNAPDFANCAPDPGIYGFLLHIFAGSDTLTVTGKTDPILTAP